MNYFYIIIKNEENIVLLRDTIELIKKYCLRDSNKYSITLDRKNHSNCTLDNHKQSHTIMNVYEEEIINYYIFKEIYKKKYNLLDQDIEVLLTIYKNINIDKIEEKKVQVKINYNVSLINALELIVNLLGKEKSLNNIYNRENGENFNQLINNEVSHECAIIENNYIYHTKSENGSYKKYDKVEFNENLRKYEQYKRFNKKFKKIDGVKSEFQKI